MSIMKAKYVLTFFSFVTICFIYHGQVLAQKADMVLTNGKIFTSDTTRLHVQAIAIKGNKIIAIGTNEAVNKLALAKTNRIDLKGKTVVPVFNDAHDHLAWLIASGKFFYSAFSVPGLSRKDVINSISRLVKLASPGQWVQGTIGLFIFNDPSVRRQLLDSLAPHNPLVLYVMWGHGMVINSAALKSVHIPDTGPNPLAGWYERNPGTN
jgi:predicted amidohydrolase YtcJ